MSYSKIWLRPNNLEMRQLFVEYQRKHVHEVSKGGIIAFGLLTLFALVVTIKKNEFSFTAPKIPFVHESDLNVN